MLSLDWAPRELSLGHVIVLIAEEISESPLVTCSDAGPPPSVPTDPGLFCS